MNSTNNPPENSRENNTERPQYGVRVPRSESHSPTASAPPTAPSAVPDQQASVSPKAARRMGRGLSFTVILLGALVGLGLMVIGFSEGWIVGATLALLGVLGYVMVQFQIIPLFR
ncbi:MAG: hypothetical protein L0G85_02975, partial [Kocuria sp.]|nr:hypothetical protein [Kocuria sp.]